jgi:hypothetical protein
LISLLRNLIIESLPIPCPQGIFSSTPPGKPVKTSVRVGFGFFF